MSLGGPAGKRQALPVAGRARSIESSEERLDIGMGLSRSPSGGARGRTWPQKRAQVGLASLASSRKRRAGQCVTSRLIGRVWRQTQSAREHHLAIDSEQNLSFRASKTLVDLQPCSPALKGLMRESLGRLIIKRS